MPRRRHGARQDGDDARPSRRPAGTTSRRVSALGRAQLGDRGRTASRRRWRSPCTTVPNDMPPPSTDGESASSLAASDLVVTTYGLLTRDLDVLAGISWSTVVLDEAQFVKNPSTRSARAVRRLHGGQRIALTGTPVENRLSELWAILDWVNPGMLGSREKFRHRYSKPIERGDDGTVAAEAAAALKALTQPFVLRRSKADRQLVPELPDKIEQVAWAGLTREQATLYQKVVDELLEAANENVGMRRRAIVLAALTKLKQICNHPAHALGDGSRLHGRSGKLTRFDELVDELVDVDERALVFTQFVEMGTLLRRHVAERFGWTVPFLRGSTTKAARDRVVADFQAGRRASVAARVAQGGRHRTEPHGGEPGDPLRPLVEPGGREPGHRSCLADRSRPDGSRPQARVRGHRRGAHRQADRRQAGARRPRRRARRGLVVRAVHGGAGRPRSLGRLGVAGAPVS